MRGWAGLGGGRFAADRARRPARRRRRDLALVVSPVPGRRRRWRPRSCTRDRVLCAAWAGSGRHARGEDTRRLVIIAGLWLVPLALGPALFSRDVYSYLAQGTVLHVGANPYHTAPDSLAGAPRPAARRGLAFLAPHDGAVRAAVPRRDERDRRGHGNHLVAGVLVTRADRAGGRGPAGRHGAASGPHARCRPGPRLWLAVLNPLVALELVAAGHNDVLMAALLVAGDRRRPAADDPCWGSCSAPWPRRSNFRPWPVPCSSPSPGRARSADRRPVRFLATARRARRVTGRGQPDHRGGRELAVGDPAVDPGQGPPGDHAVDRIGYTVAALARDLGLACQPTGVESAVRGGHARRHRALLGLVLACAGSACAPWPCSPGAPDAAAAGRAGRVAVVLLLGAAAARRLPRRAAFARARG